MSKAVCIILMIMLHAFDQLAHVNDGIMMTFLHSSAGFLGAGAFMICMGIGMRYSRHQDPMSNVTRGIALLTVSQLVNLLRVALAALIAFRMTGERLYIPLMLEIIQSDIMTFAGMAFLFMALLKWLRLGDGWILAIGFVMNLLMIPLSLVIETPEAFWPHRILNLFIVSDDALFPLGSHFVFVAFGYLIGGIYPRIRDKDGLSGRVLMICLPISVIYILLRMNVPFPMLQAYLPENEPSLGPDAVFVCLNTLILLSIMYRICRITGSGIPGFMKHLSKHINRYYCVSEVLIGSSIMICLIFEIELSMGQWMAFLFGVLVIIVCFLCIECNARYIHLTLTGLQGMRRVIVYTLIWAASLALAFYALAQVTDSSEIISQLV